MGKKYITLCKYIYIRMGCCGGDSNVGTSAYGRNSRFRVWGNDCGPNRTGCRYCHCNRRRQNFFWYVTNGSYAGRNNRGYGCGPGLRW